MKLKNRLNNIQFTTMSYLITFSVVILLILWSFQIIFLKTYYEKYQINKLDKVVTKLREKTHTKSEIETIAYENDLCIQYVLDNENILFNGLNNNCVLKTKSIGLSKIIDNFILSNKQKEIIKLTNPRNNTKSILYNIKLNNSYVFLNTSLEDVNSTTSALRGQLIYITLIVIIVAIIASIFLSKVLNKNILHITKQAKKLAKGYNDLDLNKSGITELDELIDALEYANKEIKKTDELRRDLLANLSHDLKTPLTMIKAYAEMNRDLDIEEVKRKENLNIIIDETDRLNILVNDILNLSKLEANYDKLEKSEFDLVELVNEIIKKYNIVKELEDYKFVINMPKEAKVFGDYNKISQVIYNLVNNAINYTGEDKVVKIEVIEKKKTYLVKIIDTGKGIKKEDLNIIWDKYYKNEKNHKRNKIGTGIGLSIVKNILEKHNFKYGVESEIDKGTTFYFEIDKNS